MHIIIFLFEMQADYNEQSIKQQWPIRNYRIRSRSVQCFLYIEDRCNVYA